VTAGGTPPPSASIRRATSAEMRDVVRIWEQGWADAHTGHVPDGLLRYRRREHFEALARDRIGAIWVADAAGVIAGFIVEKHDEVEQLYVDRAYRGTGIAALLLRSGEARIAQAGHRRSWLAVVAGNERARAFYARCGWHDAGPMSYEAQTTDGTFPVPTHRYERDLADHAPTST
jgi:GNAT superfamily N-acetyltransferase